MNSAKSWLVFWVGVFAYVAAVMQRSTLGVAGVSAVDRFDATASALSTLAVLQLVVYAAMQVPVGVLIDRLGPRVLIAAGLAFLVAGQLVLAFAPSISIAVLGRILVGAGDAAIFVSVMRLVTSWFSGPVVPQLSQWMGNLGQAGQILSAIPFAWLLNAFGWTPAFVAAASFVALALVLALAVIRDRPAGTGGDDRAESFREALGSLKASFQRPGTRLGFWSHYVTQSSGTVFALLWGYPFMVYALDISETTAASMLLVIVASGVVIGPLLGILSARYPYRRSNLVLGIVAAIGAAWTLLLLWPGTPPLWVLVLLLVVLGAGGPGSLIGFDFARTFNPVRVLGSANGVVNVGGFLASFVMMFFIGLILDSQAPAGTAPEELYTLDSFRLAFVVQYLVIGFGVVMLMIARRRTRRRIVEEEGIQVGPLWVAALEAIRRRRR
ncbi:MFS transporter [Mycetocola manganoxydans]|uniref:MFS transporter n=1 Tax=Mycetocola manganoxydans TaxID=699879 RepID=A0A3L6ZZI2_9MICO|nr:MFS transporter [Mycetocola manganoxydans]RLP72592.1 MFS transporter [Mycetocola manganoxydans]GHD39631.1 MFS transporter [Mycetocola manganoxydans]